MNEALLSSNSVEWSTPRILFDGLDEEFGFTLDACASRDNAKCGRFYSREQDGLAQPWPGVVWVNPPYGRQIARWVEKAYASSLAGSTVVCLLPARTDTRWWHDVAMRGEVRFLRGRIYFENPDKKRDRAPFPSAVVVFRPPFAAMV